MRIMYINNDGSGFADFIDIATETTVGVLFDKRVPHGAPGDYLIRVNRQPTTREQLLQEGDRVSITPTKIEGAASGRSTQRAGKWLLAKGHRVSIRTLAIARSMLTSLRKQVPPWKNQRIND
jgi:hypothetical protein